jgi:hypothetical protein
MRHVKNPRREGKYLEAFDRALSWARLGQRVGSEHIASPDEAQSLIQPTPWNPMAKP